MGIPDGEYGVEQSAAALFFMFQDQVSSCAAAASLEASLVPHGYCVAIVFFNFLASVFVTILDMEQSRLGSCEMLGKSQSKDMKVMYFFENLWVLLHQVFLFSGCFGIREASLIGAAAAWTLGASSYFQKQVICLVAAACTSHAFWYILALDVLDVLMRLGQSVCFFPDVDVLSEFGCELGCSAAAALECDFWSVNPESVLGSDGEVGHNTASSLTASQVFGKVPGQFETEHEVHQTNWDIGKSATFQVLVKQLSGQHLAVSVHGDWLVADSAYCLQLRSLVPAEAFYLVKAGRHLAD